MSPITPIPHFPSVRSGKPLRLAALGLLTALATIPAARADENPEARDTVNLTCGELANRRALVADRIDQQPLWARIAQFVTVIPTYGRVVYERDANAPADHARVKFQLGDVNQPPNFREDMDWEHLRGDLTVTYNTDGRLLGCSPARIPVKTAIQRVHQYMADIFDDLPGQLQFQILHPNTPLPPALEEFRPNPPGRLPVNVRRVADQ